MENRLPDARLYVSPDPGSTSSGRKRKDYPPMPLSDLPALALSTSGQSPGAGARQTTTTALDALGTADTSDRHAGSFRPH